MWVKLLETLGITWHTAYWPLPHHEHLCNPVRGVRSELCLRPERIQDQPD